MFTGSSLFPDLKIGAISALFHGSAKVLKVKELIIRLVIMGAITGELSLRILALTLSQQGALFEGRTLNNLNHIACGNGLKCIVWTGVAIRLARIKSLCPEC